MVRAPRALLPALALLACGSDGDDTGATATTPTTLTTAVTSHNTGTGAADASSGSSATDAGPTTGPVSASGTASTQGTTAASTSTTDATSTTGPATSTTAGPGGSSGPPPPACAPVAPTQPPGDCAAVGVTLEPPYDQYYSCYDLGEMPGVPKEWGGVVIDKDDPNILLAGGAANTPAGQLYAVPIARDEGCHIVGYRAAPTAAVAAAEYNDGGLTYHPESAVLFLARWPVNQLGQLKPGSATTDKVIDLTALGVVSSPGGFTFVPAGFPGEHTLKAVSWPGGEWYTVDLAPDGGGTYDITKLTTHAPIVGGPEAFVYISDDNPEFPVDSLLVAEWSAGNIAAYEADPAGDPVLATRKDFIKGLAGAESAHVDALSGDFLFATFAGVERLVVIRGFLPQPQ